MSELQIKAKTAAEKGLAKLEHMQDKNTAGKFVYAYDAATGNRIKEYNELRHFGTIWAMLNVAKKLNVRNNFWHMKITDNAVRYGLQKFNTRLDGNNSYFIGKKGKTKLGGSGLAMLACLEHSNLAGITAALQLAKGIKMYLTPGNSDFYAFLDQNGKPIECKSSDYYNGEALFGLFSLAKFFRDNPALAYIKSKPQYYNSVVEFMQHEIPIYCSIIERYAEIGYGIEFDSHWMCYAIAEYCEVFGPNNKMIQYGIKIAQHILDNTKYLTNQRSTPIACRSEALLAIYPYTSGEFRQLVIQRLEQNITEQLKYMLDDGAVIESASSSRVQIDYIQHNISAFMNFALLDLSV